MYSVLDAYFLSVVIVVGSIMVTPIYVMAAYAFSGASAKKGFQIGIAFFIWGSVTIAGRNHKKINHAARKSDNRNCFPGFFSYFRDKSVLFKLQRN